MLTNTRTEVPYNTYTNDQTTYYEADGNNITIYTYVAGGYQKTNEYDIRSDWQINNDGELTNGAGITYDSYNSETEADYYSTTSNSECAQLATVYEYSEVSFDKTEVTVVTTGWYLDGTTLRNSTDLAFYFMNSSNQKELYFDKTIGCPGPGKGLGITKQVRDYNGGSNQSNKTVMWYDTNADGTITIYSDIDDFNAPPGTVFTMDDVETNYDCAQKFLTPPNTPPNYGFLPVSLVSLKATATASGGARVQWVTQSETNNDYFTLYRSYNGYDFEAIATIDGAGTSTVAQFYEYTDKNFISNLAYYKIGQTDLDGTETMSITVAVQNVYLPTFEIETLQNNGNGNYTISFLFPDSESENNITIYNIMSVKKAQFSFDAGTVTSLVEANLFPSGTYFVEHTNGNRKTVKKIVVK